MGSTPTPVADETHQVVCVWPVRRANILTLKNSFLPDLHRPGLMPGVSTYRAGQICGATSKAMYKLRIGANLAF